MTKPARTKTAPAQTAAAEHCRAMHAAVDRVCDAWPHAVGDIDAIGFPPGRGYDTAGTGVTLKVQVGSVVENIPATGVEVAAITGRDIGYAVGWVAELHDTVIAVLNAAWPDRHVQVEWQPDPVRHQLHAAVNLLAATWVPDRPGHHLERAALYRLADHAAAHWPPPPKQGTKMGGVTVGERTNTVELCGLCQEPTEPGRNEAGQSLRRRIDGQVFHTNPCYYRVWRQRRRSVA